MCKWMRYYCRNTLDLRQIPVDGLEEEDRTCIICFGGFSNNHETNSRPTVHSGYHTTTTHLEEPLQLPCIHVIGHNCLMRWAETNKNTCPMCREEFQCLYPADADVPMLNALFEFPLRPLSPELVHILYGQDWPLDSWDNRFRRSSWAYDLYAQIEREDGSFTTGVSDAQRESFVEWFNDEFHLTRLTADQEVDMFDWLSSEGHFDGKGFEFIKLATGLSELDIYRKMILANVFWDVHAERFINSRRQSFLPEGFNDPSYCDDSESDYQPSEGSEQGHMGE